MATRTLHFSRADLLRLIGRAKPDERDAIAALVGFERRASKPVSVIVQESIEFEEQVFEPPVETKQEMPPVVATQPIFWRVVEQHSLPDEAIEDEDVPAWWTGPPETRLVSSQYTTQTGASSLLHWPRLQGFYRTHLIIERRSSHPDEQRLVRRIAEGRFIRQVPRKCYRRWPPRLVMVIDNSHALYPLWRDYARMVKRMRDLFGVRLQVIRLAAQPDPTPGDFQLLLADARLSPESAANARWLILSDMGSAEGYTKRERFWRAFLHWLHDFGLGHPPLALVNAPVARWWYGLGELARAAF